MRVGVGHAHLEPQPAVVRDGQQVVDRVQLTPGVARIVHARDTTAQLEGQRRLVPQQPGHLDQVLPPDVQGELAAVDHDPLDGLAEA